MLNQEEGLIRDILTRRNIVKVMCQANIARKSVKRCIIERSTSQMHMLAQSLAITKEVLNGLKAVNVKASWQPETSPKTYKQVKLSTKEKANKAFSTTRNYHECVLSILKKTKEKVQNNKEFLSLTYDSSKRHSKQIARRLSQNPPYVITSPKANERKFIEINNQSLMWNSIDVESVRSPRGRCKGAKKTFSRVVQRGNGERRVNEIAFPTMNGSARLAATISLFKKRTRKNDNLGKNLNKTKNDGVIFDNIEEGINLSYLKQKLHLQVNEPIVLLPALKTAEDMQSLNMTASPLIWIDPLNY
eukprot:TRINITY_DN8276_c0_g1_i7.p1 TRINITY_DN8276_c0_g1~~TRINITY_DN8276_c0_g1_i7.p1  ORF type:complete len:303 (-),score=40.28 TRINITY_DN8276_c0_g1_i7:140-1048(-)